MSAIYTAEQIEEFREASMKRADTFTSQFAQYRRKQIAELRPYVPGEDLIVERVSISAEDLKAGSPKQGDMIARNPKNHADQWLVAAAYFADNFEPIDAPPELTPEDHRNIGEACR